MMVELIDIPGWELFLTQQRSHGPDRRWRAVYRRVGRAVDLLRELDGYGWYGYLETSAENAEPGAAIRTAAADVRVL